MCLLACLLALLGLGPACVLVECAVGNVLHHGGRGAPWFVIRRLSDLRCLVRKAIVGTKYARECRPWPPSRYNS